MMCFFAALFKPLQFQNRILISSLFLWGGCMMWCCSIATILLQRRFLARIHPGVSGVNTSELCFVRTARHMLPAFVSSCLVAWSGDDRRTSVHKRKRFPSLMAHLVRLFILMRRPVIIAQVLVRTCDGLSIRFLSFLRSPWHLF